MLDAVRSSFGTIALIRALRVVLHGGASRYIPLTVEGGASIAQSVIRHCSNSLRADAMNSLRDGETLTFGPVALNRDGIRGRSWAAPWKDISLVRFTPVRVMLFRYQRLVPWRTIRLDRVPHPTVFAKLVSECAIKKDIDDTLALLSVGP